MERDRALDWLWFIACLLCDAPISETKRWDSIEYLLPYVLDNLKERGVEPGSPLTSELAEIITEVFEHQVAVQTMRWCSP